MEEHSSRGFVSGMLLGIALSLLTGLVTVYLLVVLDIVSVAIVDTPGLQTASDWMQRNLANRVETILPVLDDEVKQGLQEILDVYETDNCSAWDCLSDGRYVRRTPAEGEERTGLAPSRGTLARGEWLVGRTGGRPLPRHGRPPHRCIGLYTGLRRLGGGQAFQRGKAAA